MTFDLQQFVRDQMDALATSARRAERLRTADEILDNLGKEPRRWWQFGRISRTRAAQVVAAAAFDPKLEAAAELSQARADHPAFIVQATEDLHQ